MLSKAGIKSPADLKTMEQLEKLQADILAGKIGLQDIRGDVYTSPFGGQVELPRSFTVLGQKFVLDSWVTAKVVFDDILWDNGKGDPEKVARRVPSCLDVAFAALGNDQVVPLLVDRMNNGTHKFRDRFNYQHNLAATRNVIDAQQASAWDENLYMGWLATLRELSKPTTDSKYPEAMRTLRLGDEIPEHADGLVVALAARYHPLCQAVVHVGRGVHLSGRLCRTRAARLGPHGKNDSAGGRPDGKNALPQGHVHPQDGTR